MVARLDVGLRAMRTALKIAIVVVTLAAVAWSATFLYWHVRIARAIRTMQQEPITPDLQGALDVLDDAGCRAIPYLVGALDPGKYTTFLTLATTHLAAAATASDDPIIRLQREYEQRQEWRIEKQDPPAERQRKCDLLRAWWAKDGGRYHQAWRVWSSSCAR